MIFDFRLIIDYCISRRVRGGRRGHPGEMRFAVIDMPQLNNGKNRFNEVKISRGKDWGIWGLRDDVPLELWMINTGEAILSSHKPIFNS